MNKAIDEMTIKELRAVIDQANDARELFGMPRVNEAAADDSSHWQVGKNYFIRTVTHHLVGKLVKVTRQELVLLDAAWVADDGRLGEALAKGVVNESEPFPDGDGRGSLIDAVVWNGVGVIR